MKKLDNFLRNQCVKAQRRADTKYQWDENQQLILTPYDIIGGEYCKLNQYYCPVSEAAFIIKRCLQKFKGSIKLTLRECFDDDVVKTYKINRRGEVYLAEDTNKGLCLPIEPWEV